uniref:MTSSB n=1 Tax=Arundo donax TaxID=35708 RepID=A0A0A9EDB1_ARUDO
MKFSHLLSYPSCTPLLLIYRAPIVSELLTLSLFSEFASSVHFHLSVSVNINLCRQD